MQSSVEKENPHSFWFVGASYGPDSEDQTKRFLEKGIWQNGYEEEYLEEVRSMQPGDKIAIKSTYTRKHGLPFNNQSESVSVMGIKAIGTITKNRDDGRFVDVDWEPQFDPIREWYFYTLRKTLCKISPSDWKNKNLIDFTFNNEDQDIEQFLKMPKWEKYSNTGNMQNQFAWTKFYEAFAKKLLEYKDNRSELITAIHNLSKQNRSITGLQDKTDNDTNEPLQDICPFTVFGLFNRGLTKPNRISVAKDLANILSLNVPVPTSFEGIPVLHNQKSWFFAFKQERDENDIDTLWKLFATAISFVDEPESCSGDMFKAAYNKAINVKQTGWNLSIGLYWIRPWKYPTLDKHSRNYLQRLNLPINNNRRVTGDEYLRLKYLLEKKFSEDDFVVHSFPELSKAAREFNKSEDYEDDREFPEGVAEAGTETEAKPIQQYAIDNIIEDGCFLDREYIENMLEKFRDKKSLILQGPPGTGKTWLARRLAFALIGAKNDKALSAVQFHPNLSYEDFVRGWRPSSDGELTLTNGPFLQIADKAKADPDNSYVMLIEEINRGNPAQIFGEMLTLLEVDKRTPDEALGLAYRRYEGEKVHIPDNLYVIGTMNMADRSLALVDFALRRRFAFYDMKPVFGETWRNWVHKKADINIEFLQRVEQRLLSLNEEIENDLGSQFKIGHSYVTPPMNMSITNPGAWYKDIVEYEIVPLLKEYWFDEIDRVNQARENLMEGF